LTLALAARQRGWEVSVAAPSPLAPDIETVSLRAAPLAARTSDLVHCHGVRSGLIQPLLPGRPSVVTGHGLHVLHGSTGVRYVLARQLTRRSLSWASRVICVSSDEFAAVSGLGSRLAAKAVLIENGIPAVPTTGEAERLAAREELGLAPDDRMLLFVGGLRHQKHPELAVEGVLRARDEVPGLRLFVVGDGPLRRKVDQMQVDWLRVFGQRNDVDRFLVACDAVINTSRWEGLSLALLEALWRGRPLIVTDAPGNRDAVGNAGRLVASPEPTAVADAIEELFCTPGLLDELGRNARLRAEELFDARMMVAKTLSLYEDVVAEG
jgi:glycosyltransferase involved in cell wall biosynthesis